MKALKVRGHITNKLNIQFIKYPEYYVIDENSIGFRYIYKERNLTQLL